MSIEEPAMDVDEKIEGIDNEEDDSLGGYPLDALLIRNESRTVHDVLRRIGKGSFIMNPDFQRDFIWSPDKQSKLIESVLMRIPLPVFYLAENKNGDMVVVDGLQRLSTFQRFVDNKLRLKLPEQSELNKKRFEDLSPKLQNRIEDCNLILYIIDAKVPLRALLDIFDRVNSGVPLTRQQMRNCLCTGPATNFLRDEAGTELFLKVTGNSLKQSTMRDREMINRFCSFQIFGYGAYRGDMDTFLTDALEQMNSLNPDRLNDLSAQFRTGLRNNYLVFGKYAFRKYSEGQSHRGVFNASLWDVMSTGLSRYPEAIVEDRADALRGAFHRLMTDPAFVDSITLGTNQLNRVETRFAITNDMLTEVIGDYSN